MANKITLGSLFDGISGFPVVASWYGINPIWSSEIDSAPIRIATRHFPNMNNYGDITQMHGNDVEPVDIITGGSPCQDLSVAGNRAGISTQCPVCGKTFNIQDDIDICPNCGNELESTRSGLFVDYIRVIKEMRTATNECYPKIVLWENVPGALNSNNGDDFYIVLKEFCSLIHEELPEFRPPKWEQAGQILGEHGSIAWRVLDAQYWGVPQRRRRIFLIVDLAGQRAPEILFKPESLRRHYPQSETPWQRFTSKIRASASQPDRNDEAVGVDGFNGELTGAVASPLRTMCGVASSTNNVMQPINDIDKNISTASGFCPETGSNARGIGYADEQSPTLKIRNPPGVVCCLAGNVVDRPDTATCNGKGWRENAAFTLNTIDRHSIAYAVSENQRNELRTSTDISGSLTSGGGKPGQGYPCVLVETTYGFPIGFRPENTFLYENTATTLCSGTRPGFTNGVLVESTSNDDISDFIYWYSFTSEKDVINTNPTDAQYEISEGTVQTLKARMGTGGWNIPLVVEVDTTEQDVYCIGNGQVHQLYPQKTVGALNCLHDQQMLVDTGQVYGVNCRNATEYKDLNGTLQAHENGEYSYNTNNVVRSSSIVRRITPLEAERLQGFEDNWTAGEADTVRYKALGNSIALPCVSYIMSGIMDVLDPDE